MKKISFLFSIILILLLSNGCSRVPVRTAHHQTPAHTSSKHSQQHSQKQAPQHAATHRPQRAQANRAPRRFTPRQVSRRSVVHRPTPRPVVKKQTRRRAPTASQRMSTQRRKPQHSPVYSNNPARNRMVKIAKSIIGTRYKWGGNNPREGFDCSGLTSFVHKQAVGIRIPRTTAKQRDKSKTISYAQLQPGDMLFFKTGKRTNHVGVYIGNRQFIHAPSRGKRVHISSMDSKYWHSRFVKFGSYL